MRGGGKRRDEVGMVPNEDFGEDKDAREKKRRSTKKKG